MAVHPVAPASVIAKLGAGIHGASLLVGPGQWPLDTSVSRVFVLRTDTKRPRQLWEGPIADGEIDGLRIALGRVATVVPAEFDAMFATEWTLAWSVGVPDFRLYDERELHCAVEGGRLCVNGRPRRELQQSSLRRVVGWVGEDWVERGVSVELDDGERVVLAKCSDRFVQIDPTYDGLNLLADCSWVASLGRALAQAIGVEYVGTDPAVR